MPFTPTVVYRAAIFLALIFLFSLLPSCTTATSIEISTINHSQSFTSNIFIEGAVNNPGLYPFGPLDNFGDLIQAAGGLKEGESLTQVTLTIPEHGSDLSPQRVNINTADAWLLAALPGIGDTYAKAIVTYRVQNGPFRTVADLLKIKGFGQTTLDKITDLITVS